MPRLFTDEDAAEAVAVLARRYAASLDDERFELDGRLEPGFAELRVALVKRDGSFRYDLEVRAEVKPKGRTPAEARELVLDFLGYYLDLYLEGGRETLLPLDFQPFELGGQTVQARGDVTNPNLDRMADEILEAGVPLAADDPRHQVRR